MRYTKLKRIAAVLSFGTLMTSFVAYRSGAFEHFYKGNKYQPDSNGLATVSSKSSNVIDSPPAQTPSQMTIMLSSKSGYIASPATLEVLDTILHPTPLWFSHPVAKDSSHSQSIIGTKQIQPKDPSEIPGTISGEDKSITIMSSSKSAQIFTSSSHIVLDLDTTKTKK